MITIGADPELFLIRDGQLISGIDKIGGTKAEPRKLFNDLYAVQEDNVSWEYNIPPSTTPEAFTAHNMFMLGYLASEAAKHKCGLAIVPSGEFSDAELDHPMAHVFGCDADFDAWHLTTNPKPFSENKRLRSAGGHIHVGIEADKLRKVELIRALDVILGVVLNWMEPANERAQLYGKPGAMRMKPYGVEWRTPSNFWLTNPILMQGVGAVVLNVAGLIERGESFIPEVEELCNNEQRVLDSFAAKQLFQGSDDIASRYFPAQFFQLYHDLRHGSPKKKAQALTPKNTITDKILAIAQPEFNNPVNNEDWLNIAVNLAPVPAHNWEDDDVGDEYQDEAA